MKDTCMSYFTCKFFNTLMPESAKSADYFGDIPQTKALFRKYLKESCSSEFYLQLTFTYFHSITCSMKGPDNTRQVDLQA